MRIAVCIVALLAIGMSLSAQRVSENPEARPPVTKADLAIAKRAQAILNSPKKWNRADNRECPATARTFSIYCALEKATSEKSGQFEHRGSAMQEARFVIEEIAHDWMRYDHRLMDYNNDPTTTFADLQKFFRVLQDHISKRLAGKTVKTAAMPTPAAPASSQERDLSPRSISKFCSGPELFSTRPRNGIAPTVSSAPRMREPSAYSAPLRWRQRKWKASFAIREPRSKRRAPSISEIDPKRLKYNARLTDYNNDPTVSFEDLQKLFEKVEARIHKRLAGK